MKKICFLKNLIFLSLLLGISSCFISCSKDDDKKDETPQSTDDDGSNNEIVKSKKYEIEKGIFVLKNTNTLISGVKIDTVYFKEYGAIEVKYSYDYDNVLDEITMQVADGFKYIINAKTKYGTKSESTFASGTEFSGDFDSWSDKNKTEYKLKVLPDTTIAGKVCKFYYYEASSTTPARVADYKGITMMFEVKSSMFTTTYVATDLKENADVPESKFKVPSGITYTK